MQNKSSQILITLRVTICFVIVLSGCASPQSSQNKNVSFPYTSVSSSNGHRQVTQAELQEDLFRFVSRLAPRLREASLELEAPQSKFRYLSLNHRLNYISSALDIALGPSPEANLLDMITLIELSKSVIDRYWVPKVYGRMGLPLKEAFDTSSQEIWKIGDKVLNPHQRQVLESIIHKWIQENPNQIFVESVRLSQFSFKAGEKAKESEVGGLFASVGQATVAADEAVLLGQRALYYAQRVPFLMRLQAQASLQELTQEFQQLTEEASPLNQTFESLNLILSKSELHLRAAQATVDQLRHFHQELGSPNLNGVSHLISQMDHIITELNRLLLSSQFQEEYKSLFLGSAHLEEWSNRILIKLGIFAIVLMASAGIIGVTSKVAYDRFSARKRGSNQDQPPSNKRAA